MARLTRLELGALLVIVAAGAVRAARTWIYRDYLEWDVAWYMVMGRSFLEHGEFLEPATGAFTHHFPPLYPLLLAGAYALFGPSLLLTKAVGFVLGLAFVGLACALTWNLYGRQAGLLAGAFAAAFLPFVAHDAAAYSETLLAGLYALTVWSIVSSLRRPPLILVGGLSAGLAYLTKASMGPFFLLAAAGGLAWRVYHRRWGVLRDHWYLGAGAVFALLAGAWVWRNASRFGLAGWETQPYATEAVLGAFAHEGWYGILMVKILSASAFLVLVTLPWMDRLRRAPREILRDERASALWLAALMPAAISLFFMLGFKFAEDRPAWDSDDARYLLASVLPLLWLAFEARAPGAAQAPAAEAPPEAPAPRLRPWMAGVAGAAVFVALAFDFRAESAGFRRVGITVLASCLPLLVGVFATRASLPAPPGRAAWARWVRGDRGLLFRLGACGLAALAATVAVGALFPLAVAAAGALLARDARSRVLLFSVLLLGACLAGAASETPWQRTVGKLAEGLAPGEAIAAPAYVTHYVAAVAPEGVEVVSLESGAEARYAAVLFSTQMRQVPQIPGYAPRWMDRPDAEVLPGTWLRRAVEDALGVEGRVFKHELSLLVYERVDEAAPPPDAWESPLESAARTSSGTGFFSPFA